MFVQSRIRRALYKAHSRKQSGISPPVSAKVCCADTKRAESIGSIAVGNGNRHMKSHLFWRIVVEKEREGFIDGGVRV